MNLADFPYGSRCVVTAITLPNGIRRRLSAFGIFPGAPICIIGGRPSGLRIVSAQGTRYALGCTITTGIEAKPEES